MKAENICALFSRFQIVTDSVTGNLQKAIACSAFSELIRCQILLFVWFDLIRKNKANVTIDGAILENTKGKAAYQLAI